MLRRYSAFSPAMGLPDDPPIAPGRTPPNPMQWGVTKRIEAAEWQEDVPINILSLDKASSNWRIPYTQALVLSAKVPGDIGGLFALRWQLQFGAGGGYATFLIDAEASQLITLPAEQLRVSLMAQQLVSVGVTSDFQKPNQPIEATAFFSDGTTATDPPTFTQGFVVAANQTATVTPPVGATAFRIAGDPNSNSPYAATTFYEAVAPGVGAIDIFGGDFLEDIRYASMPFNGQAFALNINNSANGSTIVGYVEWTIDL